MAFPSLDFGTQSPRAGMAGLQSARRPRKRKKLVASPFPALGGLMAPAGAATPGGPLELFGQFQKEFAVKRRRWTPCNSETKCSVMPRSKSSPPACRG